MAMWSHDMSTHVSTHISIGIPSHLVLWKHKNHITWLSHEKTTVFIGQVPRHYNSVPINYTSIEHSNGHVGMAH